MLKVLSIAGGLAGAAGLSQYPEFSQQYTQRLAGQVDALTEVVTDFEASAMRLGLTRTEAFAQMTGTQFLEDRQADMRRTFTRYAVLSENLIKLREASPLQRMIMPQRLMDGDTLAQTRGDYTPAVPLSTAGAASAGVGFFAGWAGVAAILSLLAGVFGKFRRKPTAPDMARVEPLVSRNMCDGGHSDPSS